MPRTARRRVQRLADRISGIFVPVVLGLAAVTFAAWLLTGAGVGAAFASAVAVAVLIIACPCALGLATPTALMGWAPAAAPSSAS